MDLGLKWLGYRRIDLFLSATELALLILNQLYKNRRHQRRIVDLPYPLLVLVGGTLGRIYWLLARLWD
jgi:hypothetical protein